MGSRHEQMPQAENDGDALGDASGCQTEQPAGQVEDPTPKGMEDFEDGVVKGDPDSDSMPPPPLPAG